MNAQQCQCGVRAAQGCPGAWEKGCDLGANEAFAAVAPPGAGLPPACARIFLRAQALVDDARMLGVVLTIEQVPRKPLAMGNYDTVVSVREARK